MDKKYVLCEMNNEKENSPLSVVTKIFAAIGVIVLILGAAYAIYRFLTPEFKRRKEEEIEDDFEEFFKSEDEMQFTEEPETVVQEENTGEQA